jgi:hypothetical protein
MQHHVATQTSIAPEKYIICHLFADARSLPIEFDMVAEQGTLDADWCTLRHFYANSTRVIPVACGEPCKLLSILTSGASSRLGGMTLCLCLLVWLWVRRKPHREVDQ